MKRFIPSCSLGLLIFISVNSFSQNTTFEKSFYYPSSSFPTDVYSFELINIEQTNNEGFIFSGRENEHTDVGNFHQYFLMKVDKNGVNGIGKIFSGNSRYFICKASDNGYLAGGYSLSNANCYLVKFDSTITFEWSKKLTGINFMTCLIRSSDNGYIILGSSPDVCLLKLDSLYNIQWGKTYAGLNGATGYSCQQTTDSGYIIIGLIYDSTGTSNCYIIKTDMNGSVQWSKTFSKFTSNISLQSNLNILQTNDLGYMIEGAAESLNAVLMKLDSTGSFQWCKAYGDTIGYSSIAKAADGGYVIAGSKFIKIDSAGEVQWSKKRNLSNNRLKSTADHGFIIGGSYSTGLGGGFYLSKIDSVGNTFCDEQPCNIEIHTDSVSLSVANTVTGTANITVSDLTNYPNFIFNYIENDLCLNTFIQKINEPGFKVKVFPNPMMTESIIELEENIKIKNAIFTLYDPFGREVLNLEIQNRRTNFQKDNLVDGMYFYKLVSNMEVIQTGKLIIEN